jgi:hypothetical protein
MNKEEIENKIKEILNKNIVKGTAYTFGTEGLKKELSTLIQESNSEAVEGLVGWTQLNTLVSVRDVERLRELVKEYLSSIGKEER